MKDKGLTIAYLRVSTDKQDTENQLFGIQKFAAEKNWMISQTIHDTASGAVSWRERKLAQAISELKAGDNLLVAEMSRLGRSTIDVLEVMKEATTRGINLYIVKQGLALDGSAMSKLIATMLAVFSELERDLIRSRTKEALARRRAEGLSLGRPKGKATKTKLDDQAEKIRDYINKGINKRDIARLIDCAPNTLYSWLERNGLHERGEK